MANILDSLEPIQFAAAAEVESPNWRTTWGHRHAISHRVRQAINSAVANIPAPRWDRYCVNIHRVGANILDGDNLVAACKPARDELALWLGLDDGDARIAWSYSQRQERVRDETPRAKRAFRTWLEVAVSPSPVSVQGNALRAEAPRRLEREHNRAPIRCDTDRSVPVWEVELPARPNGTRVRVSLMRDVHSERVRVCTAYMQQGHHWRTTGVALEMSEIEALIEALNGVLRERVMAGSRGGSVSIPRRGVLVGAESGSGADTPSNNTDHVGKGAKPIPSPVEYLIPPPRGIKYPPGVPGPKPRGYSPSDAQEDFPSPRPPTHHLNPRPPPMPKPRRPPPYPPRNGSEPFPCPTCGEIECKTVGHGTGPDGA